MNDDLKFEYKTVKIKNLQLDVTEYGLLSPAEKAANYSSGNRSLHRSIVKSVNIDGRPVRPTGRFWESLYAKFGLSNAFFKYFNIIEAFKRIGERDGDATIRVTIERNTKTGDERLLAATGVNKPVVIYDDLKDIFRKYELGGGIKYSNGIVESVHTPRVGQDQFKIGGDQFSKQYSLHTPIDGYGQPAIYLAMLRWICSNGAVAFANTFKTILQLGKGSDSILYSLERALNSFTNDEGYAIMRDRYETAAKSWASINEHQDLYRLLLGLQGDKKLIQTIANMRDTGKSIIPGSKAEDAKLGVANVVLSAYERMAGKPFELYNVDPNLMSAKRKRSLPVGSKVYDMLNFATELATHHVSEEGARTLQLWVGSMLSESYDLEGSCDEFTDHRDLFFTNFAPTADKK